MQTNLIELERQRQELIQSEEQRESLSQQLAMIREAESLGSALGSHQLNTLSQRYSVYKRTMDEFKASKMALLEKEEECKKHCDSYKNCTDYFNNNKFSEYLVELSQSTLFESEFELIKDFLESSAQSTVYTQGGQIRKELDAANIQQIGLTKQAFETLIQYETMMKYCPQGYDDNHRFSKYSQWCRMLVDKKSVQSCREIVAQYQTIFGDAAVKPPKEHIDSFKRQLQVVINEITNNLKKTYEGLQVEFNQMDPIMLLQQFDQLYSETKASMIMIMQKEGTQKALDCVAMTTLMELNKRFLIMENAAGSSSENLFKLTWNGKWFLDELYHLSSNVWEIVNVSGLSNDHIDNFEVNCLKQSNSVYFTLRQLNYNFLTDVLPDIFQGIISEDKTVIDMISAVSSLQDGLLSIPELLQNLDNLLRCTIMNVPSTHSGASEMASELKSKFNTLKEKYLRSKENLVGHRLCLSFSKLFEDLDMEHQNLTKSLDLLNVNDEWRKLDYIKESKDLGVSYIFFINNS